MAAMALQHYPAWLSVSLCDIVGTSLRGGTLPEILVEKMSGTENPL